MESTKFAADVLRLEVIGNTGLYLTVVDLPGLISVSENAEDMHTVEHLVDSYLDDQVRSAVTHRFRQALDNSLGKAHGELRNIPSDEQSYPITYNHYYTDNIQKAREDASRKSLQASMDHAVANEWNGKLHVSNTPMDLTKFASSSKSRVVVDTTEQACEESLVALNAYYKVAMKTFVDNVCRQVI